MDRLIVLVGIGLLAGNPVWAVDDATVQEIESKATSANQKADGNNSRIQNLEKALAALQSELENISLTQGPKGDKGDKGDPGDSGQSCSVTEGNGSVTIYCDGTSATVYDGLPGSDGADGAAGSEGPAGLSCWDTNGNGQPDPEEDLSADGIVDAVDCQVNFDQSDIYHKLSLLEQRLENQDFDGDGVSPLGGDCDDADPQRSPSKQEFPADGIDNDCDGFADNLPVDNDFDGDGLTDNVEATLGCNPASVDTDGDSLEQFTRQVYAGQTCSNYSCGTFGLSTCTTCRPVYRYETVPAVDLSDYQEMVKGLNCNSDDTDGDGRKDGYEIRYGTNPAVAD